MPLLHFGFSIVVEFEMEHGAICYSAKPYNIFLKPQSFLQNKLHPKKWSHPHI
jgi:hypothetical protein